MNSVMVAAQLAMLLPMFVSIFDKQSKHPISNSILLAIGFAAILCRQIRIDRRRVILEDELLSIHSCAIVWEAVVICHFLALKDHGDGIEHYSEKLACRAREVALNAFSLPTWLSEARTEMASSYLPVDPPTLPGSPLMDVVCP
jgi:hypothetical protein